MKVGFIGLGRMGHPMAANILKAGYELTIHDLRREIGHDLETAGARWGDTPRETAVRTDVLLTCLPSASAAEEVALGDDGVFAGLGRGAVYVDTGTHPPAFMRRISGIGQARDIRVLDAPISGGVVGARDATLTIFIGGLEEDLERVRPLLETIGRKIVYIGPAGSGNTIKLINNLMLFVNYLGACEGVAMGIRAGIEPQLLLDVIVPSMGQSRIFEHALAAFLDGEAIGGTTDLAVKDTQMGVELAEELGVPVEVAALVRDIFIRFRDENDRGQEDYSALIREYLKRSGVAWN
jgi:3-hydroxyisobutyrate dehydrogenase-like beta-hydroxyacid dehydrogenase